MKSSFSSFFREIASAISGSHRERVAALTVMEAEELENIFALLLIGSFVGLPSPPSFIAVELLPFMESELKMVCHRAKDANDMLAQMCGTLGID